MNSTQSDIIESEETLSIGEFFRSLRLQTVLTLLMIAVVTPLVAALIFTVNQQAGVLLERQAREKLDLRSQKLSDSLTSWLKTHEGMLSLLASQPGIVSMEADQQKPFLESLARAYPHLYLTMTTDMEGLNVARNDDAENLDYHDRAWFQNGAAGSTMATQTVIGRTTGQPALVMATAIRDRNFRVIGVGAIVSELDELSKEVQASRIGNTGYVYVIDNLDQIIAHPEMTTSGELKTLSDYQPVQAMRSGIVGAFRFVDADGIAWWAHITPLENGWGVISQQQESELLADRREIRTIATLLALGALLLLAFLASLIVRQALRPVAALTEAATAIAAGDLTRTAPVRRDDEIGALARAFNQMTAQLREMIVTLEERIEERTRALRASFEVSQRLATIQNLDELLVRVVEEVRNAFDYYHVQVYLYDDKMQNLVMLGGTGEAGQQMLERGHQIPAGRGLVGRAAESGQVIYVADTRQDVSWLPNPLLPETKSEVAIPLVSADQVLGVLDVQINRVQGSEQEDIKLLQSIANQVAVAVQNARRLTQAKIEADMEARTGAIAEKLRTAASVESVLEIAVRELSESLGARQGNIQVTLKDAVKRG